MAYDTRGVRHTTAIRTAFATEDFRRDRDLPCYTWACLPQPTHNTSHTYTQDTYRCTRSADNRPEWKYFPYKCGFDPLKVMRRVGSDGRKVGWISRACRVFFFSRARARSSHSSRRTGLWQKGGESEGGREGGGDNQCQNMRVWFDIL